MDLKGKNILVYGAGKSGIASVKLLISQGANIVLYDGKTELLIKDKTINEYKDFTLITGEFKEEYIKNIELVVVSPGVPQDISEILLIKERNIPIWGEIELGFIFGKGIIIGITGTNGKTTTTALVGEIMKAHYKDVNVVGNIGNPYTDVALTTNEDSITVIELSSFQLETITKFRPNISAILNISPDHLNRHHTMEEYIKTKININKNQNKDDFCILNYDDMELKPYVDSLKGNIIYFSSEFELEQGLYLKDDNIIYGNDSNKEIICNVKELKIIGRHNYENVMVAVAIGIAQKIPINVIKEAIFEFQAVEHRIEYVRTYKGVKYYNDSKGTNPDASKKAIAAMDGPTILIAGGYDKDGDYKDLIKSFNGKVKLLVLLGQTKEKIERVALSLGFNNIIKVNNLEESIRISMAAANSGDNILLSPACASWGMFKDYEERGNMFKDYVNQLIES